MFSPIGSWRQLALALLLGLALVAGPLLPAARPVQAATTFTVTTTGDEPDRALTDPVCDVSGAPGNQCTLRAAIQEANATPGPDVINFNITGGGVQTIRPATTLPPITNRVTIDGYTQPGATPNTAQTGTNAQLRIELDGSNVSGGDYGLLVESGDGTVIRGLVINRFNDDGIELEAGAINTRIAGCFIGTDAAGTADLGNGYGVFLDGGAGIRIGGSGPAARNLIAGSRVDGVNVSEAVDTRILGNLIGTDRTGAAPLGNGDEGVDLNGPPVFVGGNTAGEANVIAFNGDNGVEVFGDATANRVLRNSIFANGGLGIDLGLDDGVTPNDDRDPDQGANTLQNFPVITAASGTSVSGTLNSTPNQNFVLRLFSNPSGGTQGETFEAGPLVVTTNAQGNARFTFANINPLIPAGRTVTATATNQGGSTSEFSAAVNVGTPA